MKLVNKIFVLGCMLVLLVAPGCKKQAGLAGGGTILPSGGTSRKTGWAYNDPTR